MFLAVFFFNDTATTEIYTLSLHDALPISSRGTRAVECAVDWVAERKPDLVCVTGDLLSRPRGESRLRSLLERLGHPYVVLGNHDLALSRDPFSRAVEIGRAHV